MDYFFGPGRKGNIEEARANYIKALVIEPGYHNARLNLSTTYVNQGNELIDEMNSLGNTLVAIARYEELKSRKMDCFERAQRFWRKH